VYSVAVLPEHRRKGVAAALIKEAEVRLRELGCRKVNLQVRSSNAGVIGLYRHLGYDIEDRISMGKRI
ncbi:MAG TPA: GNAT family N-acetyltransferase, partial [Caulobacteraceae bacterium]|nr:GNAT family N-acetyltransferase [Caulobacteraceae bacterium]